MNRSEKYSINFGSLSIGIHEFMFEISDEFFEQFENSIIQKANADVLITLERKDTMLLLDFTIQGAVNLPCDRCLEPLNVEVEGYNELVVKFGEEEGEESEDVIVVPHKSYELNVAQFIYEYITMMIPLRNIHPYDENGKSLCNPDALEAIEKYRFHEEEKKADPRWDALKNINPN
jgi:uncharacterized protein